MGSIGNKHIWENSRLFTLFDLGWYNSFWNNVFKLLTALVYYMINMMNKNCTFQAQLESAVLDISVLRSSTRNILLFFFFCILIDKCEWNQFEAIATQPDWSSNQELFFVYLTSYKKTPKKQGYYWWRLWNCCLCNQESNGEERHKRNDFMAFQSTLFHGELPLHYLHAFSHTWLFLHIWTWLFECFSHQDLAKTGWLCKPFLTSVSLLAGWQPLYLKSSIG